MALPEQKGPKSATLIYVTVPAGDAAEAIARAVVTERLAAGANILPGVRSLYWWQGKIETAAETVLILKTTAFLAERAIARVRVLHPYDVPCVVALPVAVADPDYLAWIEAETA